MTLQGVQYIDVTHRNAETERHNLAVEKETAYYNRRYLSEVERSNLAREYETRRSNMANENISMYNASNLNQHYIRQDNETYRANVAREVETNRSNLANESIRKYSAYTERMNYYVNLQNADTNRLRVINSNAVDWENARTNRYGAITNYIIGSRQAAVAETNAATNWYNAETNRMDAHTRLYAAENNVWYQQQQTNLGYLNYGTESRKADSEINLNSERARSEASERKRKIFETGSKTATSVSSEIRQWLALFIPWRIGQ